MNKTNIITGGIIGLTFLLNVGIASAVDNCNVSASCEDLGYTMKATQCTTGKMIKCPFNPVYAICQSASAVGDLKYSLRSSDHDGWLLCNGSTYSVSEYPELSAVLGSNFGGAGKRPNYYGMYLQARTGTSISSLDNVIEAGLPNIYGKFRTLMRMSNSTTLTATGPFTYAYASGTGGYDGGNNNPYNATIAFNANNYNTIYGNSSTVTPPSYPANIFIYAGTKN
ncbi:MAG: phage tail protein [Alphaproteobacteria bacterium]